MRYYWRVVRIRLVFYTLFAFLPVTFFAAKREECSSNILSLISPFLSSSDAPITLDIQPPHFSDPLKEIRRMVLNSEPAEFNALWARVSKTDLEALVNRVRNGQLKASETERRRLEALWDFAKNDKYHSLWNDDPFAALHTHYPDFQGPNHLGRLGGTITGFDTSTLLALEREMLRDALSGRHHRITAGNRFRRFLFPIATPMQKIVDFNNQLRERLETIDETLAVIQSAIDRAEQWALPSESHTLLTEARALMEAERSRVRSHAQQVYGQDIFTGGFQAISTNLGGKDQKSDIYDIARRITSNNLAASGDRSEHVLAAERSMDLLHRALNPVFERMEPSRARVEKDFFNSELKVRHRQHRRNGEESSTSQQAVMRDRLNDTVSVHYRYEDTEIYFETVTHTREDGTTYTTQEMRTRIVTKYTTENISPSYYNLILDRLSNFQPGNPTPSGTFHSGTIVSVSGVRDLVERSAALAEKEATGILKFYALMADLNGLIQSNGRNLLESRNNQEKFQAIAKQLNQIENNLVELIREWEIYNNLTDEGILTQWTGDRVEHFRQRNRLLLEAAMNAQLLVRVYEVQFSRGQYELEIIPDMPNYREQFQRLDNRAMLYFATQIGLLATGVGEAACEAYRARETISFNAEYEACITSLWNRTRSLLGGR